QVRAGARSPLRSVPARLWSPQAANRATPSTRRRHGRSRAHSHVVLRHQAGRRGGSERATAILIDPCTGALGATSYWISIAAAPPGRGSYAGALGTGGLGCSRRFGPCYQSTLVRPAPH